MLQNSGKRTPMTVGRQRDRSGSQVYQRRNLVQPCCVTITFRLISKPGYITISSFSLTVVLSLTSLLHDSKIACR